MTGLSCIYVLGRMTERGRGADHGYTKPVTGTGESGWGCC